MAGLSATGFEKKRLEDIRAEIEADLRLFFGNGVNLRAGSVFATLVGTFAERESLLWEQLEVLFWAAYPTTAQGVALDNIGTIIGTQRLGATKSQLSGLLLFGTAGTLVPQGTQVSVAGVANAQFVTRSAVTLIAGVDEVQKVLFDNVPAAGYFVLRYRTQTTAQIPYTANAAAVQSALNALALLSGVTVTGSFASGFTVTFAGDDGKQPQENLTVDANTLTYVSGPSNVPVVVTVSEFTAGVAQGTVDVIALQTGPIAAPAYALTVIDTPVSGLNRVLNTLAATVGRDIETDAQYRPRVTSSTQRRGNGTFEAIRARLLDLAGVTSVFIFENRTNATDIRGLPPHSFEAVVQGGTDAVIGNQIWQSKPAGIEPRGSSSYVVTDSQGFPQQMRFSRPTPLEIYVDLVITRNVALFPPNGEALVRQAVINYVNGVGLGATVIVYPQLVASLAGIPGIVDVVVEIGTSPNPTLDNNVVPAADQAPHLDNANLSVVLA